MAKGYPFEPGARAASAEEVVDESYEEFCARLAERQKEIDKIRGASEELLVEQAARAEVARVAAMFGNVAVSSHCAGDERWTTVWYWADWWGNSPSDSCRMFWHAPNETVEDQMQQQKIEQLYTAIRAAAIGL